MRRSFLVGIMMTFAMPWMASADDVGVTFVQPADGASVGREVHVVMAVHGMEVRPAGELVPGTGHHHLIIDGGPVPKGETVPKDARHLHFGKGQTEATIHLTPGEHTLTIQFADGYHHSYGPALSRTITVHVK
ncbi:MAG: DUF4399 domain-containing protein [Mariprofundaceae bacterium]